MLQCVNPGPGFSSCRIILTDTSRLLQAKGPVTDGCASISFSLMANPLRSCLRSSHKQLLNHQSPLAD